ncbi:hypothetical protein VQ056_06295 [Paenibacillus sp. JTLBN-2024]
MPEQKMLYADPKNAGTISGKNVSSQFSLEKRMNCGIMIAG